jgi:hypothetical protein
VQPTNPYPPQPHPSKQASQFFFVLEGEVVLERSGITLQRVVEGEFLVGRVEPCPRDLAGFGGILCGFLRWDL